jgi:AcrR family transcriptional regulator
MPKIIDHQVMREDLLSRSLGLFARRGFHAVTMRELARELGVSTGTLYHYFSSKTDLYAQMLHTVVERDIGRVLQNLNESMSVEARLRVVAQYVESQEEQFRDLLFLLFDFYRYRKTELPGAAAKEVEKLGGLFRELLLGYRSAIEEHAGLPLRGVGHLVTSVLIGTLVQRIVDPKGVSLLETQQSLEALLLGPS